eukprot:363221-Chlamydomonas_euryale.AAC.34
MQRSQHCCARQARPPAQQAQQHSGAAQGVDGVEVADVAEQQVERLKVRDLAVAALGQQV